MSSLVAGFPLGETAPRVQCRAMTATSPNTKEAMMALVRKCEGGRVIFRGRRGAAWLCDVAKLMCDEERFSVDLVFLRRVDTAMWRFEAPQEPLTVGGSWDIGEHFLYGKTHAIVATGYVDWCITFDPVKVAEVEMLANAGKMPVGDLLSMLRRFERE